MKRFICLLIASVFALGGCAGGYVPHGGNYSLSDGRYVTSTSMPYLLFNGGRFTVIKDVAAANKRLAFILKKLCLGFCHTMSSFT